jgi:hypothetical protein
VIVSAVNRLEAATFDQATGHWCTAARSARHAILNWRHPTGGCHLVQRGLCRQPVWLRRRLGWALLYSLGVGAALAVLAFFSAWAEFWVAAFLGLWYGIWIAFSTFWRWADETRRVLLRRRGYY